MPYIEERLARIEAYLGLPPFNPSDPTGGGGNTTGPATPTFVRLVENSNRTTTLSWSGSAPTYEVHEFLADPANTLKATTTSTSRTSGTLTLGNTYEYAVRAVDAQGRYSPFSERIRVTVGSGVTQPGETDPGGGQTVSGAPGEHFNLTRWYVTLPIAATDGSDTSGPWDVYNPRLKTFVHSRYFYLSPEGHLKLEAPVKGVTTSAESGATRTEFREETVDGNHAAWSASSKTTSLTVTMKCDPSNIDGRKEAIVGQIHNTGNTPPVYLAVNHNSANGTLSFFKNGPSAGVLISNLSVNDWFTYRISVAGGRVKIWAAKGEVASLPATPQFDFPTSDMNGTSGCYFKCGVYNKQSISTATVGSVFGTISRLDLV